MSMAAPGSSAIQLDHWSTVLAPLNETERASVNALAEFIGTSHRPNLSLTETTSNTARQEDGGKHLDTLFPNNGIASSPLSSPKSLNQDAPSQPSLPNQALLDAPSYLSWYAKQQSFIAASTQTGHVRALQHITKSAEEAELLLEQIETARIHIAELRAGAKMVEEGTEGLREDAESMGERIDHLANLADSLSLRLSYFAILPNATTFLSSPSLALVQSKEFLVMLNRLDIALAFLRAHPHYRDAALYKMRFEHCIVRAGTLIRMFVVGRLKEVINEVSVKLKEWEKAKSNPSNQSEKGKEKEFDPDQHDLMNFADPSIHLILFERFKRESQELRPILFELEKRASLQAPPASTDIEGASERTKKGKEVEKEGEDESREKEDEEEMEIFRAPEFSALLEECRSAYFDGRRNLVSGMISNCIARIEVMAQFPSNESSTSEGNNTSDATTRLVEQGMAFITAINKAESDLYSDFFTIDKGGKDEKMESTLPEHQQNQGGSSDDVSVKALHAFLRTLSIPLDERIKPRMSIESGGLTGLPAATLRSLEAWRDYFVRFLGQ